MSWLPESTKSALRDWLGPGFLIVALLALFFRFYDPYYEVGPPIVPGGHFERPPAESGWKATKTVQWEPGSGRDGSAGVSIHADDGKGGMLDYVIADPRRFQNLRIDAWIRTDLVRVGQYRWCNARVLLYYKDSSGKSITNIPHAACQLLGSNEWARCRQSFAVPGDASGAIVALQNIGSAGNAWFDDVTVTPVARRAVTPFVTLAAISLWAVGFVWCVVALRIWRMRHGVLTLLIMLGIVAGVSRPGALLDRTALSSVEALQTAVSRTKSASTVAVLGKEIARDTPKKPVAESTAAPKSPPSVLVSADAVAAAWKGDLIEIAHRTGHVVMFATFGLVLGLGIGRTMQKWTYFLGAVFGGLLFAFATELLQFAVAHRHPRSLLVPLFLIQLGTILRRGGRRSLK
ncbi:MAG: hypothetical protein KA760_03760 [Steroidobacteraceae bacterium]|nr:hypothetical protein [Steroidobacteraceae bacterium]